MPKPSTLTKGSAKTVKGPGMFPQRLYKGSVMRVKGFARFDIGHFEIGTGFEGVLHRICSPCCSAVEHSLEVEEDLPNRLPSQH